MMTSDIERVFIRYDNYVEFAKTLSLKVDKTRQDEFSGATVLNNKLEILKKKIEGFDSQISKDYAPMMEKTRSLFIQTLQLYQGFFLDTNTSTLN